MNQSTIHVTRVAKPTPYLLIATVGLAVAKWGFGVKIATMWVFAPLWIPLSMYCTFMAIFGICFLVTIFGIALFETIGDRIRRRFEMR